MQARRKSIAKSYRSRGAKKRRRALISEHNRQAFTAPNPFVASDVVMTDAMDVVPSDELMGSYNGSDNMILGLINAVRTKPATNAKRRLGAKKANRLDINEHSEFVLSSEDATMYRALAARCNYLSQDRVDIAFSSKELCREFSVPNKSSFTKLKRLARYLHGLPRLVYEYNWQSFPDTLDVFVDTDVAGCHTTRRSTSGGVALLGSCLIKHWSKTPTTVSLSSGEAELHGMSTSECTPTQKRRSEYVAAKVLEISDIWRPQTYGFSTKFEAKKLTFAKSLAPRILPTY